MIKEASMNPRLTHIAATQAHQELLREVQRRAQRPITSRTSLAGVASVLTQRVRREFALRREPRLA
jgi:hypothetical protein